MVIILIWLAMYFADDKILIYRIMTSKYPEERKVLVPSEISWGMEVKTVSPWYTEDRDGTGQFFHIH